VNELENATMATHIARCTGRTTAICKAAKEIGAIVIVHHREEARRLEREFGVKCKTINDDLRGFSGPILYDTCAVSVLAQLAVNQIDKLNGRVATLEARIAELERGQG